VIPADRLVESRAEGHRTEMPIYEYECSRCTERFEVLRPRKERDKAPECEECGCKRTELVMSGFCGRTGSGGETQSVGSACTGCSAASCAGCKM